MLHSLLYIHEEIVTGPEGTAKQQQQKKKKSEKQSFGQERNQIKCKCLFFRAELKKHEIDG